VDAQAKRLAKTPWWRLFVYLRHPILLIFVVGYTWMQRSPMDWGLLSSSSKTLFGPSSLSLYANHDYLQVGAPALVIIRLLTLLPGGGETEAHVLLALLGWYLVRLVERWCFPKARLLAAPLVPGLTTLLVGLPVLLVWTSLSGGCAHVEDGLTLLAFALATRAISKWKHARAGLLVGLAAAFKPWGVVAFPMLWGLRHKRRALLIGVAVVAASWLPFFIGDPATLRAAGHGLFVQKNSTIRMLGITSTYAPTWWRAAELAGALAAAFLAGRRRDWAVAFAAGCTMRLLLDPAGFDYYIAGLVMATYLTERIVGCKPWKTLLLCLTLMSAQNFLTSAQSVPLRFAVLVIVLAGWLYRPARPVGPGVPAPRDSQAQQVSLVRQH
jgi:hypothetical protein